MKRTLLLAAILANCGPSALTQPLGGRSVAVSIVDCQPLQREWAQEQIEYFGWHVSDVGEVTVRCGELDGAAGQYRLGASEVVIDPTRVTDSWSTRAVAGHELTHLVIYNGPHPDRATMHVCTWPINHPVPPNCYPYATAARAMMSPSGPMDWDGDQETFSLDLLPEYRVTEADKSFIDWALKE